MHGWGPHGNKGHGKHGHHGNWDQQGQWNNQQQGQWDNQQGQWNNQQQGQWNNPPQGQWGGQQQGQWNNQPQGQWGQQQGYGGPAYAQQGNYQQNLPDSCHEHPLDYDQNLRAQCKVCHQGGRAGYKCSQCPLVLCNDCAQNIFYGNKARQVHNCPLALRSRNAWKCDVCKQSFKDTASFYCKKCDFDACSRCYVGF